METVEYSESDVVIASPPLALEKAITTLAVFANAADLLACVMNKVRLSRVRNAHSLPLEQTKDFVFPNYFPL
jgi:hypothetical protein